MDHSYLNLRNELSLFDPGKLNVEINVERLSYQHSLNHGKPF